MRIFNIFLTFILILMNSVVTNAKDDNIELSLLEASAQGRTEKVKELIASGADVNTKTNFGIPLISASSMGHIKIINILIANGANVNIKNNKGMTPLMFAKNAETAQALIDSGANVNAKDNDGFTALIYASGLGNIEIVKILIANGADITAKTKSKDTYFNGITALKQAKRFEKNDIIKILKQAGAKE